MNPGAYLYLLSSISSRNSLSLDDMATGVQAVLKALDVFTGASDKASIEGANTWLQDFQHSVNTFAFWSHPADGGL